MNRVLIIEDDPVARRQLAQLFRFEEFEVSEAESGQAGISAASGAPPDLVVCDIMMPGLDGFGVLQALRNAPETCLTPFIFLTAKAGGHDVRQGMSEGADDYITKPFDPEALLSSAKQRLARRSLQLAEAERRATDTGMLAAAALPREIEGCLGHIESISEVLAAKYESDPQAAEMRRAMQEEVARLKTLSQRLRLYSELPRLYAARFSGTDNAPPTSSHTVATETAQSVARQWVRTGDLTITTVAGSAPLPSDLLTVLVRELVDNACKFSAPSSPITLDIQIEPAYWKLAVKDRGVGMQPQQARDIGAFKQFWNGSERPGGLGLGLVLVQALARLHSGETLIESEPQNGTQVTVMIPSE
jgi:two-component system sensor histidine kinase/response regulator